MRKRSPEQLRKARIKYMYGITQEEFNELFSSQTVVVLFV